VGLRLAMPRQTPLIYLHGIVPGLYEAAWPVFVVDDRPEALSFIAAIDDQAGATPAWQPNDSAALTARRQYVTAVVRQRLHRRSFRQRVIRAYRNAAPSVDCATTSCWRRHTSCPMAIRSASQWSPTVWLSAGGVTPDLEVKVRRRETWRSPRLPPRPQPGAFSAASAWSPQ
jgi:hypothetical protein